MQGSQPATAVIAIALVVVATFLAAVSLGATSARNISDMRDDNRATPMATPSPCPVTRPNGQQPPPGEHIFGRGPGGHGNDALWTNLWTWGEGVVLVPPTHVQPDGTLGGMKWPWWRGGSGSLIIEGHRLDASAPHLRADIPGGYGDDGFQPSGLIFPTPGCWQITGRVGTARLTFVVLVETANAPATPDAETDADS